ncbi:hypothetical protein DRE_04888 [Drechslerella stenobrocha 248]|uniref:Small ribosomal subunit protein uS10 domain-containing protein n=1 Tax=Drechslerella stenobrocha 248 TaxID=1043628 RepID=W7HP59_9PEZI|nr:hypothetical protein DRE_04888 [Drechslerella stenobrocha 248]
MSYNKDKDAGDAPKSARSSSSVRAARTSRSRAPSAYRQRTYASRHAKRPTARWDSFEMRIHKRLIDLQAGTEVVKQIIINIEAGVEVEVTIAT